MHGGNQLTLYTLRQGFWIIGGRNLVKSIIRRCVTCVRERAAVAAHLMGSLPDFRTTNSRPFTHTGMDYAGPFQIRFAPGRGHKIYKGYIVLFVCCDTRVIHLELVSDYTSQGFLAAYQRFVSRRGMPAHLYSDNGTTIQDADRELRQNLKKLRRDSDLLYNLTTEGTSWHFIPPTAPNFGGIWEASVKSLKHHLRRCVGAHTLTFEKFRTTLTRIKACLNSRPIGPNSDEPDDFSYLTLGHFLIEAPLTNPPEPSVDLVPENRLTRWQIVQRITEMFWRRCNVKYLHSLQQRYKWQDSCNNLEIGSMVLIKHDVLPPSKWQLGRIIKTYVAKDGLIRIVRIKMATSEYDRPISKVFSLPVSSVGAAEWSDNHK
ncbi:uncharacterized protein LOC117175554 [Belonocnema kinseyi]|uniref:uncharacterized protein LOC117175554 n=1 Tax=Belonocnema kinseyi TaxID=2817044 RepID=UPI00143D928B|nr:uncharacterized protein LOC117175554 [Belonocnema kinseyi]